MLTHCHQISRLRGVLFPTQPILTTLATPVLEHLIQKDVLFCSSHTKIISKETLNAPDDRDYKVCIKMLPLATSILLTTLVFKGTQHGAKGQESW